jgi:hypothetical protein
MPVSKPIATADRAAPARASTLPKSVKLACLAMIHEGHDFIVAARTHGLRPDTLRRWLHRVECISFVKRERAAYRLAVCSANEYVLKQIRDEGENAMARVASVKQLEAMVAAEDGGRGASAPSLGVSIRIVNFQSPSASEPTIDITPHPAPELAAEPLPAQPLEPIFRLR